MHLRACALVCRRVCACAPRPRPRPCAGAAPSWVTTPSPPNVCMCARARALGRAYMHAQYAALRCAALRCAALRCAVLCILPCCTVLVPPPPPMLLLAPACMRACERACEHACVRACTASLNRCLHPTGCCCTRPCLLEGDCVATHRRMWEDGREYSGNHLLPHRLTVLELSRPSLRVCGRTCMRAHTRMHVCRNRGSS